MVAWLVLLAGCRSDSPPTLPSLTVAPSWEAPTTLATVDFDVRVESGDSIQEAIDSSPADSLILVAAGEHREQSVVPKEGQHILGEKGAILNGSRLLTDFSPIDDLWVHRGIELDGEESGRCRWEAQGCGWPEQLFLDDLRLKRVFDPSDLGEESWLYDPGTAEIRMGTDPTGRKVELAYLPFAFGGESPSVTIEGLVIEKYANPAQRGAVSTNRGWTVIGNEIRLNHGTGLRTFSEASVVGNYIHHNGQLGIGGGGVRVTIEDNEIAYNGDGGFSPQWEAGGVKQVFVYGLIMRNNRVYGNLGPGLWTDAGDDETLYENNVIIGNEHAGIKHEISGSAVIRGNVILENGFGKEERWPGVLIRESGPVDVRENILADNVAAVVLHQDDDRNNDTGNYLHDIVVEDNDIAFDGGRIEVRGDIDRSLEGITFSRNRYYGEEDDLRFLLFRSSLQLAAWVERTGDDSTVLPRSELELP
jgi:hypothetical protein